MSKEVIDKPVKLPDPIKEKLLAEEVLNREYHTVSDLARMLDVDRRTIIKWFDMGLIDYFNITRKKTIITKTQLAEFLKKRHGDLYRNSEKKE